MKIKHALLTVCFSFISSAHCQSVLLGGFDGSNENAGVLQSASISGVDVTLTRGGPSNDITQGFSQIGSTLWGTTDLDVDATIQSPNALAIVQAVTTTPFTLALTITNNGSSDLSLDKIHYIVKKDVANQGPKIGRAHV